MATATATCTCKTCGKVFHPSFNIHKSSEREAAVEYMQERYTECPECYSVRKRGGVAANALVNGWAQLTGSEKQIAWAAQIRETAIKSIMARVKPEAAEMAAKVAVALTERHTTAGWWIDHRDDTREIIAEFTAIAKEMY